MKKIQDIFSYLKKFHVQKAVYFSHSKEEIRKTNLMNLHRFAYTALIIQAAFLVVFLRALTDAGMLLFFGGMLVLQLLFAILISVYSAKPDGRDEVVHLFCILQLCIVQITIIWVAVEMPTPYTVCYYPIIYLMTPMLFILDLWEMTALCGISSLLMIILSLVLSTEEVVQYNISAGIGAFVISMLMYFFLMDLRIRNGIVNRRLRLMSSVDELTGIFNKSMSEYLCRAFYGNGAKRKNPKSALMVVDIDDFKSVNDNYGHSEGDRILSLVGKAMHNVFRESDIVGRIGGDEFLVVMKNTADWNIVRLKAKQIMEEISKIRTEKLQKPISCSIGIALSPNHGNTYEELFSKADRAMYMSKNAGKNNYAFYSSKPEISGHPALLVVDDAESSREIVKNIFKDRFTVLTACDGNEAMEQLHRYHEAIEVVILDLIMPNKDGYSVLAEMADDPVLRAIPVMVTTADATKELKALEMGAVDLVVKPFNPDVLRHRVDNLLHL